MITPIFQPVFVPIGYGGGDPPMIDSPWHEIIAVFVFFGLMFIALQTGMLSSPMCFMECGVIDYSFFAFLWFGAISFSLLFAYIWEMFLTSLVVGGIMVGIFYGIGLILLSIFH